MNPEHTPESKRNGKYGLARKVAVGARLSLVDWGLLARVWADVRWRDPHPVKVGRRVLMLGGGVALISVKAYARQFGCTRKTLATSLRRLAVARWIDYAATPEGTLVSCLVDPGDEGGAVPRGLTPLCPEDSPPCAQRTHPPESPGLTTDLHQQTNVGRTTPAGPKGRDSHVGIREGKPRTSRPLDPLEYLAPVTVATAQAVGVPVGECAELVTRGYLEVRVLARLLQLGARKKRHRNPARWLRDKVKRGVGHFHETAKDMLGLARRLPLGYVSAQVPDAVHIGEVRLERREARA